MRETLRKYCRNNDDNDGDGGDGDDDDDGDGGGGDADGNGSDCDDDGDSWMEGPLGGRGVMRWNLKSPPNEVTAVTNHPRRMSFDDKMMIRGY